MEKYEKIFKKFGADCILLQNCDDFSYQHCANSELTRLTGFFGTAGEGVLLKNGKMLLFVDTRYHMQADKMAHSGAKIIKLQMGERFLDVLEKYIDKNSKILADSKFITYDFACNLKKHFKNALFCDFIKRYKAHKIKTDNFDMSKIKKLQRKLKAENIFISDICDVSYLTNLHDFKMENSSSIRAKMLIVGDSVKFFTSNINDIPPHTVVFKDGFSLYDYDKIKEPVLKRVNEVAHMASIKSKTEIEQFKKAFMATDTALYNFKAQIKEGMNEAQLNDILNAEFKRAGSSALSFQTILSIGKNTASIHKSNYDSHAILHDGDLILVDCGIYLPDGLATDITRTFVQGVPTKLQKEIYTLVLRAFLNVYNKNELDTGEKLHNYAAKIMKNAPSGFSFSHALGHGVGQAVHSAPPVISPKYDKKIKKNMVFTLEPGLYNEKEFGIRLENTVYMADDGKKISFSSFPFEEKLIDTNMLTIKEKRWLKKWQNKAK